MKIPVNPITGRILNNINTHDFFVREKIGAFPDILSDTAFQTAIELSASEINICLPVTVSVQNTDETIGFSGIVFHLIFSFLNMKIKIPDGSS
jgi:hypothetical protein